jgi:hypothetical protein
LLRLFLKSHLSIKARLWTLGLGARGRIPSVGLLLLLLLLLLLRSLLLLPLFLCSSAGFAICPRPSETTKQSVQNMHDMHGMMCKF